MSECILSNKELENATKLMKIAIEHFPIPKTYTKEEQEKLIDSLLKSLNRLKEDSNELDKIRENLTHDHNGSQKDATMAFRRNLVIRGVLSDVIDEAYRRKTALYENIKMIENGDIWHDGNLMAPEVQ